MSTEVPDPMTPDQLVSAARSDNWRLVDTVLPSVSNLEEFRSWANLHVDDKDGGLRYLAVSVFEASLMEPSDRLRAKLGERMRTDDNPFVRFRSAFALFNHGDRTRGVIRVIEGARDEEDVAGIAESYLERLAAEEEQK